MTPEAWALDAFASAGLLPNGGFVCCASIWAHSPPASTAFPLPPSPCASISDWYAAASPSPTYLAQRHHPSAAACVCDFGRRSRGTPRHVRAGSLEQSQQRHDVCGPALRYDGEVKVAHGACILAERRIDPGICKRRKSETHNLHVRRKRLHWGRAAILPPGRQARQHRRYRTSSLHLARNLLGCQLLLPFRGP